MCACVIVGNALFLSLGIICGDCASGMIISPARGASSKNEHHNKSTTRKSQNHNKCKIRAPRTRLEVGTLVSVVVLLRCLFGSCCYHMTIELSRTRRGPRYQLCVCMIDKSHAYVHILS